LALLNFANVSAFRRCYNAGREEADIVARTLLADDDVPFQPAKEGAEASSGGGQDEDGAKDADDEDIV
jgi:hypothetical protein